MKIALLLLAGLTGVVGFAAAQSRQYCELHGAVYEETEKNRATFIVYEEESEAFADFLVYEEENKLYADTGGLWYFVEARGLADFSVYFTKQKGEADFIVYFTDSPTFVGCN
jgi:hypothetical protein